MKGQKEIQRIEAERLHKIMRFVGKDRRKVAVDCGAHVGSWTKLMMDYFDTVYAYEPCKESFDMLVQNCHGAVCVNAAVMDRLCKVDVYAPGRQTLTARQVMYGSEVDALALDSEVLGGLDLLKIDVEGAEYKVLIGAEDKIKTFHPFIVIELNNLGRRFSHVDGDIIKLLNSWGYKEVWRDGVDRGFKWVG